MPGPGAPTRAKSAGREGGDTVTRTVTRDYSVPRASDDNVTATPRAPSTTGGGENDDGREPQPNAARTLDELFRDHGPSIYRVAMGVLADPALAEDVVQESILRAWQSWSTFRGEASRRTWVLRIAHNVAVDVARRRRDRPSDGGVFATQVDDRPGADVERHVDNRLAVADLWEALAAIDEPSRTVLVLRELEHLSYDEIAELLGVALPTVKTRLFRARRLLATRLGAHGPIRGGAR